LQQEEQQILMVIQGLEQASPDVLVTPKRALKPANKAYFLYLARVPLNNQIAENGTFEHETNGATLYPIYIEPFDIIFLKERKQRIWRRGGDSNPR
jgi:hypothetical protein